MKTWIRIILEDSTTGDFFGDIETLKNGQEITIEAKDENGNPIEVTGKIMDVIER